MRDLESLFSALERSPFRRRFGLGEPERVYLEECLANWHRIPRGRPLTADEQNHVVAAIGRWLGVQLGAQAEREALAAIRAAAHNAVFRR